MLVVSYANNGQQMTKVAILELQALYGLSFMNQSSSSANMKYCHRYCVYCEDICVYGILVFIKGKRDGIIMLSEWLRGHSPPFSGHHELFS